MIQSGFALADLNFGQLRSSRKMNFTIPRKDTHAMAPLMVLPQSGFMAHLREVKRE